MIWIISLQKRLKRKPKWINRMRNLSCDRGLWIIASKINSSKVFEKELEVFDPGSRVSLTPLVVGIEEYLWASSIPPSEAGKMICVVVVGFLVFLEFRFLGSVPFWAMALTLLGKAFVFLDLDRFVPISLEKSFPRWSSGGLARTVAVEESGTGSGVSHLDCDKRTSRELHAEESKPKRK